MNVGHFFSIENYNLLLIFFNALGFWLLLYTQNIDIMDLNKLL